MAQRKPIVIDGEVRVVPERATIADVVPRDVQSIATHDGKLVPRERFAQVPVPEGFETNLSTINKGGGPSDASGRALAQLPAHAVRSAER